MTDAPVIRLLASSNNALGDLFTRLTKDLFFALGYDNLRLNVHKSGRELDLEGEHRLEPRRVIGEFKAHAGKMGGEELNKFFGVLSREREKLKPTEVAGYFISLNGFTETAIQQEIETGDHRLILLNGEQVVNELERSRVVVGREIAAERAGKCAQQANLQDAALESAELLGHELGYLWAIFYTRAKERTHFALIHADGTPLAEALASEVVDSDRNSGGSLHLLTYLPMPAPAPDRLALEAKVDERYRHWVAEEFGYIHLDGLPADTDLSATRMKLERLFVPLKATIPPYRAKTRRGGRRRRRPGQPRSIGGILERNHHLAVIAMPGGGKSTLLKRLATAYALPERRSEVLDNLPLRNWLPLILRCRELRDRAHHPIIELLNDIPAHAGMDAAEGSIFQESVHAALRNGLALLLVDGLDEISDEGARRTFANHLRTWLAMFPHAALVVTSRVAGFRLVAGVVASACEQVMLAPLDKQDVLSLCVRWHVEVVGDSKKIRGEAKDLGKTIWNNERIRKLAENPLLLTTLLVVKRWVGELPRSRASLYRETIRVLVRTWNVEGYAPLDEEETLAQLSYVACAMMEDGKQQIGQRALLQLLQKARKELEAELQFASISPKEFIERIEYRSSLLMQAGHERDDTALQPVYEFRHLVFQEYLAGRGYVEEQYPGRDSGQGLADILEKHFIDENWREVIPLAAVLAGRRSEELLKRLTSASKHGYLQDKQHTITDPFGSLLLQCVLDEVQVTAPTLRSLLAELARKSRYFEEGWVAEIVKKKFGRIFQEIVEQTYLAGAPGFEEYLGTMNELAVHFCFGDETPVLSKAVASSLQNALESGDRLRKVRAALVCMELAYSGDYEVDGETEEGGFQHFSNELREMLSPGDFPSALAACWALAWIGENRAVENRPKPDLIRSLYQVWREIESKKAQSYYAVWALEVQPVLPRDTFDTEVWGDCDSFLRHAAANEIYPARGRLAALIIGWYRRAPWTDVELAEQISEWLGLGIHSSSPSRSIAFELLGTLGEFGAHALEYWSSQKAAQKEN